MCVPEPPRTSPQQDPMAAVFSTAEPAAETSRDGGKDGQPNADMAEYPQTSSTRPSIGSSLEPAVTIGSIHNSILIFDFDSALLSKD
ncbi:hypothetical protein JTB14_006922 [Gonioctena quinquepunctata]|nr:hypothetical protein JTB14_006922 [Gonioctena quinquepunctata]